MQKIIILYLALLSGLVLYNGIKNVKADSFSPTGDINNCKFAHVIGLALEELDDSYAFDISEVEGKSPFWMTTHNIQDVADVRKGRLERYSNIATSVSASPGSRIGVYFFPYNFSTHSIGVLNSWLFLSDNRNEDLSSITDIDPNYRSISYIHGGNLYSKKGMSISFGALGSYKYTGLYDVPGGKKIGEFTLSQPISAEVVNHECSSVSGDMLHNYSLKIGNSSSGVEYLNIDTNNFVLNPFSEKQIFLTGQKESISLFVKEKQVCFGNGGIRGDDYAPSTHSFLVSRNDYNYWTWGAIQTDIAVVSGGIPYCVSRVRYSIPITLPSCSSDIEKIVLKKPIGEIDMIPGENRVFDVTLKNIGNVDVEDLNLEIENDFDINIEIISGNIVSIPKSGEITVKISIDVPLGVSEESILLNFTYGNDSEDILIRIDKVIGAVFDFVLFSECTQGGIYEGIMRFSNNGNTLMKNPSTEMHLSDGSTIEFSGAGINIVNNTIKLLGNYIPGEYSFPFVIKNSNQKISLYTIEEEHFAVCSQKNANDLLSFNFPEISVPTVTGSSDITAPQGYIEDSSMSVGLPNTAIVSVVMKEPLILFFISIFYILYNFFANILSGRGLKSFKLR